MQLLTEAREKMGLGEAEDADPDPSPLRLAAARCWALLLVRIYECLPLLCPSCHRPMRIIAFLEDPPVVEKILRHIGELDFDQVGAVEQGAAGAEWPEMDQTAGSMDETWD